MIKFENTEVVGLEHAIRGMRNPMNSWDKSDTTFYSNDEYHRINGDSGPCDKSLDCMCMGFDDRKLMMKLSKAGTDHRKFMRMIVVYVDITAPLYWWKEFDTYKVGTVANSCSTMHKIHAYKFTIDDFSTDNLNTDSIQLLSELITWLNFNRECYLESKDKKYWWQIIQLLPSSYNQRRTVMMNYEVLANIYKSRKGHKLDEWSEGFISWIESLSYSKLITGKWAEKGWVKSK